MLPSSAWTIARRIRRQDWQRQIIRTCCSTSGGTLNVLLESPLEVTGDLTRWHMVGRDARRRSYV